MSRLRAASLCKTLKAKELQDVGQLNDEQVYLAWMISLLSKAYLLLQLRVASSDGALMMPGCLGLKEGEAKA